MTTLDEFMAINPNAYMAVVDTWRPQTTQFKEAFDDYKRWAGAPAGTEWTGRTANAAYEAASLDCHGSDNADDAAEDIVTLASATITHEVLPPLNNGKTMIENALRAKDQGVSIDQNFNMSYTPPEGMSEETAAKNRQHVEDAERQIKEYVAKWEKGCQTLKGQADTAAQKITGCINPKTALVDGRKVLRDVAAPKPGDGPATVTATSGKPHGYVAALQGQATETPDGATKPAGAAGADTSIDYKKVYPKDVSVGDKNVDPSKLGGIGSIPGTRDTASGREPPAKLASALKPQDVPAFKEMTRETLIRKGVPADQIEAQVNKAVEDAQTPRLVRTADIPSASPTDPKYIDRDFGEQFNRFTNGISDSATKTVDGQIEQAKILTGQAGPGAPGVAEAWKQVGLGAVQQAHELTTDPLAAPKMGIEQAKDFYNNPSEFIGKSIIHGTEAAAGGVVGGEVAAGTRGLLGDLTGTEGRALTHGIEDAAPGHHPAPPAQGEHHTPAGDHGTSGDHSIPEDSPSHFAPLPDTGPYQLPERAKLETPSDGAFFWSGRNEGGTGIGPISAGGNGAADLIADGSHATTLEGLLDSNGIKPPRWSPTDDYAQQWWNGTSQMYAENASGEVRAVVGSDLRPGNVWQTVELPRLMDNPNVSRVVVIDPDTGIETTVFER